MPIKQAFWYKDCQAGHHFVLDGGLDLPTEVGFGLGKFMTGGYLQF